MHDLLITNALICDGTGAPLSEGAVAVTNGRIAAVNPAHGHARDRVDAQGLVLAPGFVDVHTHYDAQLTWDPMARPSPEMGVTTVVVGNCGFGIAPCRIEHRNLTLRSLTKVEGMPLEALLTGVRWEFETFGDYLDQLAQRGVGPNVAAYANHSCIRTYVMGEDAVRRAATPTENAAMADLLREAMHQGAIGLGTSTLEGHNGDGGIPMPSRFADDDEFRSLAAVLGEFGRGVLQITKGESPSIGFLEELAATSGRPVQVCPMLQDPGQPEHVFECMQAYTDAHRRGRELYGQVSPFPEIMDFSLREPFPLEGLETWGEAMATGDDRTLRTVLEDRGFRERVKAELSEIGAPFRFSNQWSTMTIKSPGSEDSRALGDRSIADVAVQRGTHPLDCLLDIALADDLKTEFTVGMFNAVESEVARLLTHERSCIGLGDAGAHLTFFCQAGTGLFLLQRYVRERGDLTLEDAIQRLTSAPADAMRIPERGRIVPGAHADLVLLDPAEVGIGARCQVADLPGGLERVHTPALGVHGVWVNGTQLVNGTGKLIELSQGPGSVLREFHS